MSLCLWLSLSSADAVIASQQAICSRSSGGTRDICPNLWAHLVPSGNRFHPGSGPTIALIQGESQTPTAMTVRFSTKAGELVGSQTLPAPGRGGVGAEPADASTRSA